MALASKDQALASKDQALASKDETLKVKDVSDTCFCHPLLLFQELIKFQQIEILRLSSKLTSRGVFEQALKQAWPHKGFNATEVGCQKLDPHHFSCSDLFKYFEKQRHESEATREDC